jgi:GNAT superfamily N-acetyltransferase
MTGTPLDIATTSDGRRYLIRSLQATDKDLIVGGLERMSEQSRYRRFLAPKPSFSARELAYLTEIDHHDHEALIALDGDEKGGGEAVGVARYVRLEAEPRAAEPSIAVVDEWQGVGVGRALLERLIERARGEGIDRFRATVLRDNSPVLSLLTGMDGGGSMEVTPAGPGVAELDFELQALPALGRLRRALRAAARGEVSFRLRRS